MSNERAFSWWAKVQVSSFDHIHILVLEFQIIQIEWLFDLMERIHNEQLPCLQKDYHLWLIASLPRII